MKNFGLKEIVDAVFKIGLITALFTFLFFQNQRFEQSKDKGRYHRITDFEDCDAVFDSNTGKSYYYFFSKHETLIEDPVSAKVQRTYIKPDYSKMSDEELAKRAGVELPEKKPPAIPEGFVPVAETPKPENIPPLPPGFVLDSEAVKEKPDYSKMSDLDLVKLAEKRGIITKEAAKKARERINASK
jgi:hypothetical protein